MEEEEMSPSAQNPSYHAELKQVNLMMWSFYRFFLQEQLKDTTAFFINLLAEYHTTWDNNQRQ